MLLACPGVRADETKEEAAAPTRELVIEPQGSEKDWDASIADVEKVLRSAAGELWKHVPQRKLHAIRVQPKGGPIATTIKVAEGGQFEIVGKFEETPTPKVQPDPNFIIDPVRLYLREIADEPLVESVAISGSRVRLPHPSNTNLVTRKPGVNPASW